ncbi:MAG: DUF188 domain-containing protein [Halobacteriovorax sp.]|nr:DUF188 domain-containing protein [Halobacteriovorax sp.]
MDNFKIWIDADACPKDAKELVFKSAARLSINVCLVANAYIPIPITPLIRFVHVDQGADVADQYIVDHVSEQDLVITADIPLAAKVIEKSAIAINPRGEVYTEDNISERLSMRDFMSELRDSGMNTGGPAPYGANDRQSFANGLNKILTQILG